MAIPEDGRLPAGVQTPVPHLGAEVVCVCGVRKSQSAASSVLSPVSMDAQNQSYMTPLGV